jgi:RHS repeat-associated protein
MNFNRYILFLGSLLTFHFAQADPKGPCVSCNITGTNPVTAGSTYTYTLGGGGSCLATNWTVTCGSIQSSTSTTITVYFSQLNCTPAVITAKNSMGVTLATYNVTVNQPPALNAGTISNASQTINYNSAPAQLNCSAASGGNCGGSYTYQWYSSTNGSTYTGISGANSRNYTPGNLTVTTYFERETVCTVQSGYSNVATVTVTPTGTISPAVDVATYNTEAEPMTVSAEGGNGTYTYQWQSSPNNSTWTTISGATGTTYTPPGGVTGVTYYQVLITSGVQGTSSSAIVKPDLYPGVLTPDALTIASGTNPGQLDADPASGGSQPGIYTYQWESSTNGSNYITISGATSQDYSPGTLTSNVWYRRRVTSGSDTADTNPCQITVGSSSSNLNFIRSRAILKAGVTDTVTADGLTSPYDVAQSTQYYDGIGRMVQSVAMEASPLQNDMVSSIVYDNFGRKSVQYLPYTATTNDGNYKATAIVDQYNFNSAQYPGEEYYYNQIVYEASPLNRPLEAFAPGADWVGNNTGVSSQYLVNTASDSVQIWNISSVQLSAPVNGGAYPAGVLFKTLTSDEDGHQMVEYKDKIGRTILKKVQQAASPSAGHLGWLCTYYVYDTLQNLRVIIQPQAVALINGSWTISQSMANELCFRYEYDGRRRLAIRKVPGAGQAWMVYDARDRIAMKQDSLMRSLQKWMYIKYDSENRPDSTGFITDPTHYNNLAYHDSLAYYSTDYPTVASYTNELLTLNFYDDYSWVSTYSAPVGSSMATNYTSNGTYFITSYNSSPTYAVTITPFAVNRGMPTGSMKKVVGTTSQYLYSSVFYDDRGRVIQSQSVNYTGAIDTVTMQYNFNGKVLRSLLNHRKNGNTVQNHIGVTKMDYDHRYRLRHVWMNLDNAATDQLIDSLQYNESGQLNAKYLGNQVDSIIYSYNVRGWLTGINKNYVAGTANHYFGMELGYDKTTSVAPGNTYLNPEYNGTIEGIVWKGAGSGINRKYDFTYDDANRLTSAAFLQNTSGSSWDKSQIDYSVNGISYDANGNILTLTQRGFTVGGSAPIDSLTYSYLNTDNSNKLMGVTDAANNDSTLLEDFHYNPATKQSTDYNYDGNGNLIQDNNKNIDTISYNYLNLPSLTHIKGEGHVAYTYDAGGTKLSKVVTDSVAKHSTTILYVGAFIYQQTDTITNPGGGTDSLQYVMQPEGRVRWAYHKYTTGTTAYKFEYDFFEKDHVGNTRAVLTQERDTTNYLATMEPQFRSTEVQLFGNITNTSYAWNNVPNYLSISSSQMNLYTNPNDSCAKVDSTSAGGQKVGPNLLLKVMSGDTVNLSVQCYYVSPGGGSTNNSSFSDVLNSLSNGLVNLTGGAHGNLGNLTGSGSTVYNGLGSFLSGDDTAHTGYPKAYLNWIFLDDQFNYVSSLSGSVLAASSTYPAGSLNLVAPGGPIALNKSGYMYIWVSNETTGWDVYYDNLSVQYKQGPLLEENHYYPFGLTMAGISDKAIKTDYAENKYRFNGGNELQSKEFRDGSGLEMYDAGFRMLDPQLGRFTQIDPMADRSQFTSAYAYANDNPILMNDPTGLRAVMPNRTLTVHNTLWCPSIEQVNQMAGVNNDMGADEGNFSNYWGGLISSMGGGGGGGDGGGGSDASSGDQISDQNDGCPIEGPASANDTYGASFAGDNTDLDQLPHDDDNGILMNTLNLLGESTNESVLDAAYSAGFLKGGGLSGIGDALELINTFEDGESEGSDVESVYFGDESAIADHIKGSDAFQSFASSFEAAFVANMTDPSWNGAAALTSLAPNLTSDLYLHTVMGGYQYLQADVSVSDDHITFQFTFTDHFGAGVDDSYSFLPGVSSMYLLQHYYGNDTQYTPFVWSVSVIQTVSTK